MWSGAWWCTSGWRVRLRLFGLPSRAPSSSFLIIFFLSRSRHLISLLSLLYIFRMPGLRTEKYKKKRDQGFVMACSWMDSKFLCSPFSLSCPSMNWHAIKSLIQSSFYFLIWTENKFFLSFYFCIFRSRSYENKINFVFSFQYFLSTSRHEFLFPYFL